MLPPSPPRLSRANSANGGGTRDQWHVTNGTGPLTSIEGAAVPGRVLNAARVESEPSLTLERAVNADDPSTRPTIQPSRSWGGGLVSGAVSAAVFGAAVGLTAYRLWSDWGRRDDDGGPPPESPTVSTHDLPPAYESLADSSVRSRSRAHSYGQRDSSSRSSMSPTTRSTASDPAKRYRPARMRRKRPQRPSIADLVAVASTSASPRRPERASASSASVSVMSGTTAPTAPDSLSVTRDTPDLSVRSDADEDEEDEEMNARLDVMAQRLQGLITEGRRALDSTPIIEETSPSPERLEFKGLEVSEASADEAGGEAELGAAPAQAPDTDTGSDTVETLRDGSSTLPAASRTSRSSSSASLTRSSTSTSLATRRSLRSVSQGSTPSSSVRGIATVCPVPPLPWSKVHKGPAPGWVQRPFNAKDTPPASPERSAGDPSKPGAVSLEQSKPGVVGLSPSKSGPITFPDRSGAVTPPPPPPRPESVTSPTSRASRIPRPGGGHSRTSSTSTGVATRPETASPAPSLRRQSSRQSNRPQSTRPLSPPAAPAAPQRSKMHRSSSIKEAIASLERTAAAAATPVSSSPQLTPSQRSKIPIRRSLGGGPLSPADTPDTPQPPLPAPTVN
ncbi:hypothetical protein Q8F55_006966 [Vanrija albida]|uniref:Uncharacterized protein n=1 Tax=Vanrija albida TaxID=181172 RepID=A0ABR3PYR3_9TREE